MQCSVHSANQLKIWAELKKKVAKIAWLEAEIWVQSRTGSRWFDSDLLILFIPVHIWNQLKIWAELKKKVAKIVRSEAEIWVQSWTGNRWVDMKLLSTTGGTLERGIELPLLNVVLPSGVQFPNHHYGLTKGLRVFAGFLRNYCINFDDFFA